MPPQIPDNQDDYMHAYLKEAGLEELDLQAIDLEQDAASERMWHWSRLGLAVVGALILLWAGNTDYFQIHLNGTILSALLWLLFVGCMLWAGSEVRGLLFQRPSLQSITHLASYPTASSRKVRQHLAELQQRAETQKRWVWLGCVLIFGGLVCFYLPQEVQWQGNGYSGSWFLTVGAALATGISAGRWLIAQAEAARKRAEYASLRPTTTWHWPPWMKWFNLACLALGGCCVAFAPTLLAGLNVDVSGFSLSGIGLLVGIGAAIWIGHRFDEWEADFRQKSRTQIDPIRIDPPDEKP